MATAAKPTHLADQVQSAIEAVRSRLLTCEPSHEGDAVLGKMVTSLHDKAAELDPKMLVGMEYFTVAADLLESQVYPYCVNQCTCCTRRQDTAGAAVRSVQKKDFRFLLGDKELLQVLRFLAGCWTKDLSIAAAKQFVLASGCKCLGRLAWYYQEDNTDVSKAALRHLPQLRKVLIALMEAKRG